jgi:adenosylmethionine-8-amino-7-oxononanoate aminotransferase
MHNTLVVGAACSTIFSGKNLHRVLSPGLQFEEEAMAQLAQGLPSQCLSVHTSAGIPPALDGFIGAIERHLPWEFHGIGSEDWMVSLQIEGASAVLAACDLLLQLQQIRGRTKGTKVAVGEVSYHGPQSSTFGSGYPLKSQKPRHQIAFPVPSLFARHENESEGIFHQRILEEYDSFLDEHAEDIGVLLVEPQWGSSVAAMPWPPGVLQEYIHRAQNHGILVCCDEIMCGLSRHGQGPSMFASSYQTWNLQPDAVTFGKAIGGGVYPLSGVILREGAKEFKRDGLSVMQMHTYSGASTRALMAGQATLELLPDWFDHVAAMGHVLDDVFGEISDASNGVLATHGQGMMWGGLFTFKALEKRTLASSIFHRHCRDVLPYFVPAGGFMITPPLDTGESDIREAGRRLRNAVEATVKELNK